MITQTAYPSGVWLCDFEFRPKDGIDGNPVSPVCMVAREYFSGRTLRLWENELSNLSSAPFPTDTSALFVAYFASAEINCFLALGWPIPENILDLFVVFRTTTNGKSTPAGNGLIGAMSYFGVSCISGDDKDGFRKRILVGEPWTEQEKLEILDYCSSDVEYLAILLPHLAPKITKQHALLHGRYMAAVAEMESVGTPIDKALFDHVRDNWQIIRPKLISEVNETYGVFDGEIFRLNYFEEYLRKNSIPWPVKETGRLNLSDETFGDMARVYTQLMELRELRSTLSCTRLFDTPIGSDGRNRCMLSPFGGTTGRNQPSSLKFIFGPSTWLRGFIKPPQGFGIAYIDWSQQEFGIAAALSGDANMMSAYHSGDPYLAFAKQAGAVPSDASKKSHSLEREQFKQCVLAVQYGMGAESLATRIKQPTARARQLLHLHRITYPTFWAWSERVVNQALLGGVLHTTFGWRRYVGSGDNARSIQNFPMQANGAEMLRLACIRLRQDGVRICAPVHDAILIEAPLNTLDAVMAPP